MNIAISVFSIDYKLRTNKIHGTVPAINGIILEYWMNSINEYIKSKYIAPILKKKYINLLLLENTITAEETIHYLLNIFIDKGWEILKLSNSDNIYNIIFVKQIINPDRFNNIIKKMPKDTENDDIDIEDEMINKQLRSYL
tara:strand:- start:2437 stop:2859 length:423 start_codon:yes stop_codon:yes gene_type:complete